VSEDAVDEPFDLLVLADLTLPMTGPDVLRGAAVGIRAGEIAYVGPAADAPAGAARTIEAPHSVAIPGLVNAHTHVSDHAFGTLIDEADISESLYEVLFPMAGGMNRELIYPPTLVGMWDAIRSGVTTVCDLNMHADAAAEGAAALGMRAVVAEKIVEYTMDTTPRFDPVTRTFEMNWDRAEAERLLAAGVDFAERWRDHPLVTPAIGPLAADHLSTEMLRECAAAAESLDVQLLPHIAQTTAEIDAIKRRGYDGSIYYLDDIGFLSSRVIGAHMVFLDDAEIAIAAERDVAMAFNPLSMLACRCFPPIEREIAAGLRIGFGTDAFSMDMLADMRPAIYVANLLGGAGSLGAYTVLRMATIGAAEAIGLGESIGTIEVGKRADLTLIDLDAPQLVPVTNVIETIAYYATGRDVSHTIVDGSVIYEHGRLTHADQDVVMGDAKRAAAEWLRVNRPVIEGSALEARIDEHAYGL
jgi:5-methylthioadenosine/S-adenosylhomocysteine deaminase